MVSCPDGWLGGSPRSGPTEGKGPHRVIHCVWNCVRGGDDGHVPFRRPRRARCREGWAPGTDLAAGTRAQSPSCHLTSAWAWPPGHRDWRYRAALRRPAGFAGGRGGGGRVQEAGRVPGTHLEPGWPRPPLTGLLGLEADGPRKQAKGVQLTRGFPEHPTETDPPKRTPTSLDIQRPFSLTS